MKRMTKWRKKVMTRGRRSKKKGGGEKKFL
jgi:hypothetical protein